VIKMTESEIFVFGDSLSDTGNFFNLTLGFFPPAPYFKGRASNGLLAVELLAAQDPNYTLKQTNNFALLGARTGKGNSLEDDLGGLDLPGLRDQVDFFSLILKFTTSSGKADKNGLYVVWAGPNDFLDYIGGSSADDPSGLIADGATNLSYVAMSLHNLGAEKIVLPNLTDLGQLPSVRGLQAKVEATAISRAFNAALALKLSNLNFAVTEVDLFTAIKKVGENPASFGFTNITDPLLPLQLSPTPPRNPEEFFFWDTLHPTTQGHQVLANIIERTITGDIPQLSFNKILGTHSNDIRVGTSANDDIRGDAGNGILNGLYGDDRIQGGEGNDKIIGDRGDDILSGGDGADSLNGGWGNDIVFGGSGDDQLFGELGEDILIGDAGNDFMQGGDGSDYLLGGKGRDRIWGNNGQDILNGGDDEDKLFGAAGSDTLTGGYGADILAGGHDSDRFVWRNLGESLLSGFDRLTDLDIRTDFLDFSTPVNAAGVMELGLVSALTQDSIDDVLTNSQFVANGAATFSLGVGYSARTFLAINDNVAGFQQNKDAVIEITGFSGKLIDLEIV
jgi:phospholipase/lecithinase/hemolysin